MGNALEMRGAKVLSLEDDVRGATGCSIKQPSAAHLILPRTLEALGYAGKRLARLWIPTVDEL